MSGPPRVRSTNIVPESRSPRKMEKKEPRITSPGARRTVVKPPPSSCSSDAASCCSSDASPLSSSSSSIAAKAQCTSRSLLKREMSAVDCGDKARSSTVKRCAWVTPSTESVYAAFHDEEWGVPVHDDKKLFELLVLSGALADFTWPSILTKRHIFREVFLDFDFAAIAKLNEKKIATLTAQPSLPLTESKLRSVIENARQICKIVEEFGSFDKYIWNFVGYKPIVNQFRYPRQVPIKSPKAEVISKDLVRRGFRSVGPTVIYSFMQGAGLTNDHLSHCYRFQECLRGAEMMKSSTKQESPIHADVELTATLNDLNLSQ